MTTSTARVRDASLGVRLLGALQPVFDGNDALVVTDSRPLLSWLLDQDVPAVHFTHLEDLTAAERANVVAVPTTVVDTPSHDRWREHFADSRVLIVAGVSFDPSFEAMTYTLEQIAATSIPDCVARNTAMLDAVAEAAGLTVRSGGGAEMHCVFDEVTVLRPKVEAELEPGEWESIGAYCEVGLVSVPDEFMTGIKPGFEVSGQFTVDGVSVACHRHVGDDVRSMAAGAWELLRATYLSGGFPLRLTLDNAVVREVRTADGRDLAPDVLRLTNAGLGGMLTELSFSTNAAMEPREIDWTVNSQMNEGALGVHIAAGEGLTGAHVDFIATGATTTFSS